MGFGWYRLTEFKHNCKQRVAEVKAIFLDQSKFDSRQLFESQLRAKNGKVIWTQWTNSITENDHIVGIAQNITEKKELEQRLLAKNKENELLLSWNKLGHII